MWLHLAGPLAQQPKQCAASLLCAAWTAGNALLTAISTLLHDVQLCGYSEVNKFIFELCLLGILGVSCSCKSLQM